MQLAESLSREAARRAYLCSREDARGRKEAGRPPNPQDGGVGVITTGIDERTSKAREGIIAFQHHEIERLRAELAEATDWQASYRALLADYLRIPRTLRAIFIRRRSEA